MALTKITANIIEDGAISTASLANTSITADKLAATLDLTGKTITVATATAGDNDTTVASTAFVSTAIANLADSAPETLNTLNELAAALGDDANFSTTVTNSIALKAPLASPDFTGDATFDTSTLVIDSTNNRVGIGTTSPLSTMHLSTTGGGSVYLQDSDATSTYNISEISNNAGNFGIQTRNSSGTFVSTDYQIVKNASGADYHRWFTQGSERMRIDSSGNLLVGKTAVGVGNAGIELRANNLAAVSRSGDNVLYLNRISNDGSILELRKDNVVAGNIGTYVGYPYIGKGDTTLLFNPDGDRIIPRGTNAAQRDAAIDLGGTSDRFKDLYLSGTASIGNLTIAGAQGTDGQVLTSTGSGVAWEATASSFATLSDVTVSTSAPAITTNPSTGVGTLWLDKTLAELYVCTDATTNVNIWKNLGDGTGSVEFSITGGNSTATSGGYKYHIFTSSGNLVVSGTKSAEALIIAGGGGGGGQGANGGGGGGAGGVVFANAINLTSQTYAVTVGAGGVAGNTSGGNGGNSSFQGETVAIGGGGGGTFGSAGNSGGSGGGGGRDSGTSSGGAGTSGQGNAGGHAGGASCASAGGGGGAGQAGVNGAYDCNNMNATQSDGGDGVNTYSAWATATSTGVGGYYAGGGAGAVEAQTYLYGRNEGGLGGGGIGAMGYDSDGTAGTANTGSGGGGGQLFSGNTRAAGAGGSGLVIIRYAV